VPAPKVAIDYWNLSPSARLRDVVRSVRADEAHHQQVNHRFADELTNHGGIYSGPTPESLRQ
jgi:ubiquinol oxidase